MDKNLKAGAMIWSDHIIYFVHAICVNFYRTLLSTMFNISIKFAIVKCANSFKNHLRTFKQFQAFRPFWKIWQKIRYFDDEIKAQTKLILRKKYSKYKSCKDISMLLTISQISYN